MNSCECDTLELVRKARLGDRESLNRLAETVRVRLHEYVFRLTLQEDLTQDIVQETILEMLRLFGKLRQTDRFWAWLQGIAFNKVRNHFGRQWRRKTKSLSEIGERELPAQYTDQDDDLPGHRHSNDALANAVTDELKQIVLRCIESLEPRQRAILTMRCYDQMSYADISKLMDCSEIGARALFYRAKKALTSRLSRHGLGKGALIMALVLFGKMTAATKATAAEISITASTLSVGPTATLLATATSKAGILTLAAVVVVGVGSIGDWGSMREGSSRRVNLPSEIPNPRSALVSRQADLAPSDRWYYFPEGPRQAVMMRLVQFDDSGENAESLVLQNQFANYHFDYRTNTVHVKNHRTWEEDLSVRRLPTDSPGLSNFLSQVERRTALPGDGAAYDVARSSTEKGLLIMCRREGNEEHKTQEVDRHLNVLEEEYFQFGWPQSARRVDERDAIHRHGRTYFRIHGQISGVTLTGTGRLPLVYAASRLYYPWLELRVGNKLRAVDTKDGAVVYDQDNHVVARYAGGSFFKGLARPWQGLHSIDTVRRDAAEQRLWFETQYEERAGQARVVVQSDATALTYVIDMEKDLLDGLELGSAGAKGSPAVTGQLTFTYIEDEDSTETTLVEPRVNSSGTPQSNSQGMLWL
ncbi:MAG: RNA polymerase sigma factor, partial [Phycisphaerales bacterium]